VAFVREQRELHAPATDVSRRALEDFCQILFASNAFLYLD
jgi:hypothetical protein